MNKELKEKWIEALRSGEYKQGTGKLRSHDNKFCCLGVLCDSLDSSIWEEEAAEGVYSYDGWRGTLSPELLEQVDIPEKVTNELIRMNDDKRIPFDEIADYIEVNL